MHIIFFSVEDLSILTITSKSMRNLVEGYKVLMPVIHKELLHRVHASNPCQVLPLEKQSELIRVFHKLGMYHYFEIDYSHSAHDKQLTIHINFQFPSGFR